jgi:hypothetical protein
VTVAEVKAIVEAAIAGVVIDVGVGGVLDIRTTATGSAASLEAGPTTAAAFGVDNDPHLGSDSGAANAIRVEGKDPGAYANRIEAEVRGPTSGDADEFDLAIIEDGVYRETFPNLSMDPAADRYLERALNDPRLGSIFVRVIDQLLPGMPVPDIQTVALTGGDDGLGNKPAEFIVLRISQDTRALEAELAAAGA